MSSHIFLRADTVSEGQDPYLLNMSMLCRLELVLAGATTGVVTTLHAFIQVDAGCFLFCCDGSNI